MQSVERCFYSRVVIVTRDPYVSCSALRFRQRSLDCSALPIPSLFNYRSRPLFPLNVIIDCRAVTLKSVLDDQCTSVATVHPYASLKGRLVTCGVSLSALGMCRKHFA